MLKEELDEIDDLFVKNLEKKIVPKSQIVFMDSFNSNNQIVEKLCK